MRQPSLDEDASAYGASAVGLVLFCLGLLIAGQYAGAGIMLAGAIVCALISWQASAQIDQREADREERQRTFRNRREIHFDR